MAKLSRNGGGRTARGTRGGLSHIVPIGVLGVCIWTADRTPADAQVPATIHETRQPDMRRSATLSTTFQEETMFANIRPLAAAVSIAAAATIASAAGAQPNQATPARNVVLVHGAFADGSGWRGVYDELTSRGYRVTIVQNPLTSLADDVAATLRALERQDGPTILVGHSWGGTVITEAGIHPKVVGLVYVSALAPDIGETTAQQYDGFQGPPEFVIETDPDGYGFVNLEKFGIGFAADASEADAAFLRDSQVPINMSNFGTPLQNAAWRTKPSWAVIATDDKAFDQRMLLTMAERIGAEITRVKASHAVFMTQPQVVAEVIEEAAKRSVAPRV